MRGKSRSWYYNFYDVIKNPGFWFHFPILQAFQRYQHSVLGPLWMVIPTSLFVLLLGSLYSIVMAADRQIYMLHLAVGYVSWGFITTCLVNSSITIKANKNFLMQGNIKAIHVVLKGMTTNMIATLHSAVIIPLIMIYFNYTSINIAALLIAIPIFVINAVNFGITFALLGARLKDLSHLVSSIMRVLFFATPIIWLPGSVRGELVGIFLYLNPFYYYLEIIREPFFGRWAEPLAYQVVIGITIVSFIISDILYRRLSKYYLTWV